MTRSAPAGLPDPDAPRGPLVPSSGVLAVTRLLPGAGPGAAVPLAPVQETLELGLSGDVARPRLRLVARDGTELDDVATRFATTLVEVLTGVRGAHQLLHWTTVEIYEGLTRRAAALQRAASNAPPSRRLRAQLRSVHVSQPQPGAAELSIHVRHGARSRAIAARMELLGGRWRCCALQLG